MMAVRMLTNVVDDLIQSSHYHHHHHHLGGDDEDKLAMRETLQPSPRKPQTLKLEARDPDPYKPETLNNKTLKP